MEERLQKVMARAGLASRRRAEELIRQRRVTVNGRPARLGDRVDRDTDRIEVDGIPLPARSDLVYYLLNKPVGVISTADDPHDRPAAVDLVPDDQRVFPVGRLDADSEGLVLLTNDGELTELVTHPRHGVDKTYAVLIRGNPGERQLRKLEEGIELEDGPAAARSVRRLDVSGGRSLIEIVMAEGRKREVRRMFEAIGFPVVRLVRVGIGPISDRSLAPGEWRPLTTQEVRSLYRAAGRR